ISLCFKRPADSASSNDDRLVVKKPCSLSQQHYKPPHCMRIVLMRAMTKAENTPYTMTGPASLKMLVPTPRINPSVRCSIAEEMTELPNPVTGTAVPAPAHWTV